MMWVSYGSISRKRGYMFKTNSTKQLKIGVMFPGLFSAYEKNVYESACSIIQESGHHLFALISGLTLDTNKSFKTRKHIFYKLFDGLDGVIIISTPLVNHLTNVKDIIKFIETIQIPVVSLGIPVPETSSIIIDNYSGFSEAIKHLILHHQKKKIAFIEGNCDNHDSHERLRIYKEVLSEHNLEFPDSYITSGNLCSDISGNELATLINNNPSGLDAVICANDAIAAKAINEAKQLKLKVPEDIAITGFDNSYDCGLTDIPMSTVNQPIEQALKEAMTQLEKTNKTGKFTHIHLKTKFIQRRSCGCFYADYSKASSVQDIKNNNALSDCILNLITTVFSSNHATYPLDRWKDVLLLAFASLNNNDVKPFLLKFENLIHDGIKEKIDPMKWLNILLLLVHSPCAASRLTIEGRTKLLHGAGRITEELISLAQISEKRTKHSHYKNIYDIVETFANITDYAELKLACVNAFSRAGIDRCAIFIYSDQTLTDEFFTAYRTENNKPVKENFSGYTLKSMYVKLTENKEKASIILPIYGEFHDLGYIIINDDMYDSIFYHIISIIVSNALRSIELLQTVNSYSMNLEEQITERTHELEKVNEQLQNLDTLKNDFIANITHDFKSPLSVVINMAELCLETGRYNNRNFELIHQASLKLKTTVDRLLNLARMDARGVELNLTEFDLKIIVEKICDFYQSTIIGTNIKIKTSYDPTQNYSIYSDQEKIEDVLNNILSNAIKFVSPDSGLIEIAIEKSSNEYSLTVTDNGIGIEPDMMNTIFRRFEQTEQGKQKKYRGTGIGLDYSKQLMDFLKGSIQAQSDGKNRGSRFIITIPRNLPGKTRQKKIYAEDKNFNIEDNNTDLPVTYNIRNLNNVNEYENSKALFCIITHESNTQKTVYNHLIRNGYSNVIQIYDQSEALAILHINQPDIIIADLTQTSLYKQIADAPSLNPVPMILLTRIKEKRLLRNFYESGMAALLTKPINETELIGIVKYHINTYFRYRKMTQQLHP
jgi:signal transduction histidine kinase/DNA-binding LacI/PurR family transcriptional regulator/CheY-like chemotaxis protein